ncbi:Oxygen-evolving enhancer protein 3, chloroplastic [Monoraphidium neglectum]|uniref:Oxygen-evolving enhancer protein 3, chloroplastic n=1 Tax=Monoraphidium neglectum TaxID=145388 RepID=A0A0D2LIF3_9CHLO|nr:Oxygen-evolving enhancer protein 3, chloroplastic [Monoraphidium neglectum]KIY91804.1 Oxygen-evolving enhancer protein 3, chloroplastic [Monoraphidium neglectum]|eukprot:XP_013890824.1 Oxygen-evolving enhancer protein 3, chloroplastic [Monoraphidium neglectum]
MALKSVSASATQRAVRPSRSAVVVRASAESRRAVLSGFASAAAMLAASAARAATPIDLFDDRKVKDTGFDIIYEARELDLPQNVRDGFTQARTNLDETRGRVRESKKRLDNDVQPFVDKAYWWAAERPPAPHKSTGLQVAQRGPALARKDAQWALTG